jgi:hypothetical protein
MRPVAVRSTAATATSQTRAPRTCERPAVEGRAAALRGLRPGEAAARRSPRRRETGAKADREGDTDRHEEHRTVDPHRAVELAHGAAGGVARHRGERAQRTRQSGRQDQPRRDPACGQEQALQQEGARQPAARRPERGAQGRLRFARHLPGEQQARHVGSGDQQHEGGGGADRQQLRPQVAHEALVQRGDSGVPGVRRARELALEPRAQLAHGAPRLGEADSRLEARGRVEKATGSSHGVEAQGERHPQLGPVGVAEAPRHHTHDPVRDAVEKDVPTHDVRAPELPLPEAVAEQHHWGRAGLVLLLEEIAAALGRHAEHGEEVEGDARCGNVLRLSLAAEREACPRGGRDIGEHVVVLAPALPGEGGERELLRVGSRREALVEPHQPIRLRERQRPQQDRAHDREDRGVGADPEAEDEHDRGRETLRVAEVAQRLAQLEKHREHSVLTRTQRPVGCSNRWTIRKPVPILWCVRTHGDVGPVWQAACQRRLRAAMMQPAPHD